MERRFQDGPVHFSVMTSFRWWDDEPRDPDGLLAIVAASGGEGVEVCDADLLDHPRVRRAYPGWLKKNGLQLVAIDVICSLVHVDAAARSRARDDLRRRLDLCVELGARVAHVVGGAPSDVAPVDARRMIADQMAEHLDFASRHNLVLAIEDYGLAPELVCSVRDCLELMAMTGNRVKLVFDTGNFFAAGERAEDNLAACYDQIAMCHFKDFGPGSRRPSAQQSAVYEGISLGKGIIANATVARMLVERGYRGWVSLESAVRPGLGGAQETMTRELRLLRQWFQQ